MEICSIDVELMEMAGLGSALAALRLPFGKDVRSEFGFDISNDDVSYISCSHIVINPQDTQLMSTLINSGDEHAKVLRGVVVYLKINAPRYWWTEMDTYRIGTERLSSESTMHIQGKGLGEAELLRMKSELKEGTMQTRIQMFSYQTLRRIYFQRRNHRLPQWREFCRFIESLPYAEELITIKK